MKGTFGFLSEYYLSNSVFKLADIFRHAKKENYPFVAISDGAFLYSSYKLITNDEVKPLVGLLVTVELMGTKDELLIYALNKEGYQSLIIISSYLNLKEKKISFELLKEYGDNLLIISAGYKSILYQVLKNNYNDFATKLLEEYKSNFKHFYLGLSLQSFEDEIVVAPKIKEFSNKLKIDLVPVNFMAYLKEDKDVYDVLTEMHSLPNEHDLSFLSMEELTNRYLDYPEVFINLAEVSKLFNFNYKNFAYQLPSLTKDDKTSLVTRANEGLIEKGLTSRTYQERLKKELNVILELNYESYFLIVSDFVNYAKSNNFLVGPGRGSAAGSLVSYVLNITNIDPLKYGLLFERFLNKARRTMPDIDLDFPDNKRDEVILYVRNKYGSNHVFSINTFSKYSEKSSLRDILKIKGYSAYETTQIIRQFRTNQRLDEKLERVRYISNKLDGIPRQTGTHAAGIILAKEDLRYKVPLQNGPLITQTQYEFPDLEKMGLLKIDFLGIRNLTIIAEVIDLLKQENPLFNLDGIPLDDKLTYDLLQDGDTTGIFQLESQGMRSVLRKLKPTSFNDLVALLALYRPGPMQNIDLYIERRNGKKFTYIDEDLKDILKEIYGIIVYQEQIMEIARVFAGYSLEEADLLRVGISKKDLNVLSKEKTEFIRSSVLNGKDEKKALEIYDYVLRFADYGFNKSHSVSYALVAYQMAYLKANYFTIFIQVLLSNMSINDSDASEIIKSLHQKGVKVIPPSINKSTKQFEKEGSNLIYPLTAIKNIGTAVANQIIEERSNGIFKDYNDFKKRIIKKLNSRVMEALIFSGALDDFGLNKKTLMETQSDLIDLYESIGLDLKRQVYEEYERGYLIDKEIETLGMQLSSSINELYKDFIKANNLTKLADVTFKYEEVRTLAILDDVREITTKNNDQMAFVSFSDGLANIEVTVFPKLYQEIKMDLKKNEVYAFLLEKTIYQGDKWVLKNIKEIKKKI